MTEHDAVCTGYMNLRDMSRYGYENGLLIKTCLYHVYDGRSTEL